MQEPEQDYNLFVFLFFMAAICIPLLIFKANYNICKEAFPNATMFTCSFTTKQIVGAK